MTWAPPQERLSLRWPWRGFPTTLCLCLPTLSITLLYRSTGHNPVRSPSHTQTHTICPANGHIVYEDCSVAWQSSKSENRDTKYQLLPLSSPSLFVSFSALHDLQGEVESYFLTIESTHSSQILALPPEIISTVISDLWPSTTYLVSVQVSNGAHNTTKAIVNVTTEDGGMSVFVSKRGVCVNACFSATLCFTGDVKHIM